MRVLRSIFMVCGVVLMGAASAEAACWNAEDAGIKGPAVEICYAGLCETTTMSLECAGSWGATIRYENGWSVNTQLTQGREDNYLMRNDTRLTPDQQSLVSCRNLDPEAGCRFDMVLNAAQRASAAADIDMIERHFKKALGVDAFHVQLALLEVGLYNAQPDEQWGPATRKAFVDALDWANSRGMSYDVSTEQGFYDFVWAIRRALFDIDSGLSRTPTGVEHLLVTASRRTWEAARDVAFDIELGMNAVGLPNRTYALLAANGWYAAVAGMYSKSGCQAQLQNLKNLRVIPSDSYCAGLERFDPNNWAD